MKNADINMHQRCSDCHAKYIQTLVCGNCYKEYKMISKRAIETQGKLKREIKDLKKDRVSEEKLKSEIEDLNSTLTFLQSSVIDTVKSPPPFTDIVLVASDDPSPLFIYANRAILACRSPVFRAMLENKMKESISGVIRICEVSNDALGMFVNFMYTGEAILDDDKMACELLMMGDKYQIPHLKTCCERFLISTLTWENSLSIYAFARQYDSRSLQDASLSLIVKDIRKLPKKQGYAQFVDKDPRMVLEIYEAANDR